MITTKPIELEALESLYNRESFTFVETDGKKLKLIEYPTTKEQLSLLDGRTRNLIEYFYVEGYVKAKKSIK